MEITVDRFVSDAVAANDLTIRFEDTTGPNNGGTK
jgi:hypothetical protein